MTGLSSLDLSGNQINWWFLRELTGLTSLWLSGNQIRDGSFLRELTGLTSLDLGSNQISDGSFLRGLTGLTSLNLRSNQISDGSFLRGLTGLTSLFLDGNQISDISFLHDLTGLKVLSLQNNQVADLSALAALPGLESVNLISNQVRELPRAVLNLALQISGERLWERGSLMLDGNPLQTPPKEIIRQGHAAVVEWFRALDQAERPLNEVKVILVGDGGAGKTSLRKRLMAELANHHESKTDGIEICDWPVKTRKRDVLVHFWDFGGQDIMHATHQFFLSHRSLYLLVLDGRKEEDAEYWLKQIESFGGGSPVLVVLNKLDENPGFDVNRPFLTGKYEGIRDFFRISCWKKKDNGIPALKKRLLQELPKVEMAGSVWPGKWFDVKRRLESDNRDFISYDDYDAICLAAGIESEETRRVLVRYLNDLGTAIHFEETRLRTTQVLNPRWVTQAVYRIINAQSVADNGGVLRLDQLEAILAKTRPDDFAYPADKYCYIVDLMKKFELCYELDPERILVPDLLPVQEPEFKFPRGELLRFRFEYDFLPRSILARFIVREHRDIHRNLRWRTGVVLHDRDLNATALVWADVRDRKIMIEVAGDRRREYFRRLRKVFGDIHDSFQKLDVSQKVPLPDEPSHAVDYQDLLYHEERNHREILVGKVRRSYVVNELLDGIETAEDRRREERTDFVDNIVPRRPPVSGQAEFDVFLSYNSQDRPAVQELNRQLKSRRFKTWLDTEQLQPGMPWQDGLERAISTCGAAAVCVGASGLGPWQDQEMQSLLIRFINERKRDQTVPVIPVLLPGAPDKVKLPGFLQTRMWVDLRQARGNEELDRLIWGITGKRP